MKKIKKGIILCELIKRAELSNNEMKLVKGASDCQCKDICSKIPTIGMFVASRDQGGGFSLDP